MTEDQIKHMVDRFLSWRLPEDFHPDCGIHFDADAAKKMNPINSRCEPVGTNLFSAVQATEMVRYMIEGAPAPLSAPADSVTDEELKQIIYANQGSRLKAWIPNNKMTWHNALMCMQAALTAKVRG